MSALGIRHKKTENEEDATPVGLPCPVCLKPITKVIHAQRVGTNLRKCCGMHWFVFGNCDAQLQSWHSCLLTPGHKFEGI